MIKNIIIFLALAGYRTGKFGQFIEQYIRSFSDQDLSYKIYPFVASIKSDYSKMAGTYGTEEQRNIDRIKCIAFREARDADAIFIIWHWVPTKVHRSIQFVTD